MTKTCPTHPVLVVGCPLNLSVYAIKECRTVGYLMHEEGPGFEERKEVDDVNQ